MYAFPDFPFGEKEGGGGLSERNTHTRNWDSQDIIRKIHRFSGHLKKKKQMKICANKRL